VQLIDHGLSPSRALTSARRPRGDREGLDSGENASPGAKMVPLFGLRPQTSLLHAHRRCRGAETLLPRREKVNEAP
jgi:hypothetical protein